MSQQYIILSLLTLVGFGIFFFGNTNFLQEKNIQEDETLEDILKNIQEDVKETLKEMEIYEDEKSQEILQLEEKSEQQEVSQESITNIREEKKYDFISDDSFQKFVSPDIAFQNISYIPSDLVKLSGDYIIDMKGNQTLRGEALENLQELSKDFYEYFGVKIAIVSAYRDFDYQKRIEINNPNCIKNHYCAKAGYSEHQSGLAIDIFEATDQKTFLSKSHLQKYFTWMSENAHKYGFHNSYQNGPEIDGYQIEPWHWRYVGKDLATQLWEENMTFSQYYTILKR